MEIRWDPSSTPPQGVWSARSAGSSWGHRWNPKWLQLPMTDTFADPPLYPLFQLGPNSKFHGKVWHLLGTRSSCTVNCSPSNTFRTGYSVNRWEHLEKSLWGNLACTHLYWFLCLRLAGCSPNSTWYTQCGILQYRPYSRHRSHHISVHQLRHILVKMVKSAGSCEKCAAVH